MRKQDERGIILEERRGKNVQGMQKRGGKHNTHYKKIRRNEKSNETRGIFKWRRKRMGSNEKNRQNQGRKKKRNYTEKKSVTTDYNQRIKPKRQKEARDVKRRREEEIIYKYEYQLYEY